MIFLRPIFWKTNLHEHLLLRIAFIFRSNFFFVIITDYISTLQVKLFRTIIIIKQERIRLFTGNFAWYSFTFNIPKYSRLINHLGFFEDVLIFLSFSNFTAYLSLIILLFSLFRGEIAPVTRLHHHNSQLTVEVLQLGMKICTTHVLTGLWM